MYLAVHHDNYQQIFVPSGFFDFWKVLFIVYKGFSWSLSTGFFL